MFGFFGGAAGEGVFVTGAVDWPLTDNAAVPCTTETIGSSSLERGCGLLTVDV